MLEKHRTVMLSEPQGKELRRASTKAENSPGLRGPFSISWNSIKFMLRVKTDLVFIFSS